MSTTSFREPHVQTVRLHGADILAIVVGFPSEQRLTLVCVDDLPDMDPATYFGKRGAEPVALVISRKPPHVDFLIRDEFKDQRWVQDALRGLGHQLHHVLQAEGFAVDLAFMDGR